MQANLPDTQNTTMTNVTEAIQNITATKTTEVIQSTQNITVTNVTKAIQNKIVTNLTEVIQNTTMAKKVNRTIGEVIAQAGLENSSMQALAVPIVE